MSLPAHITGIHFLSNSTTNLQKHNPQNHQKQLSRKNMNIISKTYQNGTKTNARNLPKSMPKLVKEKAMNIIKYHVILKCKIM